jgi:hypothetical protein
MTSAAMIPLWHRAGRRATLSIRCRGLLHRTHGAVDQFGASHRFAQVTWRLAPIILLDLVVMLFLISHGNIPACLQSPFADLKSGKGARVPGENGERRLGDIPPQISQR